MKLETILKSGQNQMAKYFFYANLCLPNPDFATYVIRHDWFARSRIIDEYMNRALWTYLRAYCGRQCQIWRTGGGAPAHQIS